MIIAIDFDGTVVSNEFPFVGKDIGAIPILKELVKNGHKLILYTLRVDGETLDENGMFVPDPTGTFLTDAVNWFKQHNIELYGVQEHPLYPDSKKLVYDMIIDDRAFGIPLIDNGYKPFVNWCAIESILKIKEII